MDRPKESFNSKIGIIILNWNGLSDTLECLSSLYKNNLENATVYVADNGSSDDSVLEIKKAFPTCNLIELKKNFGFAQGNNLAVEQALNEGCEYIFLLNNDTVVAQDLLKELRSASLLLGRDRVLGCKIGYYDHRELIWDFGSIWDNQKGSYRKVNKDQRMDESLTIIRVDHVIGCAMWIPATIIKDIGLFDSRFFLNYEETDWCTRAKKIGISFYSIPTACLWHKISASFGGGLHNRYYNARNKGLWLRKNFSWLERMKWYWLLGLKKLVKRILRVIIRVITIPFWVFDTSKRDKQLYRLAFEWINLIGFYHHCIGRYGEGPSWVKIWSRYFKRVS
jgi:GT2 family glycosyltransferase